MILSPDYELHRFNILNLISLNDEIAINAGFLKRHGISVADTLIAASALAIDATVVSNDPHFLDMGIPVIRYQS